MTAAKTPRRMLPSNRMLGVTRPSMADLVTM